MVLYIIIIIVVFFQFKDVYLDFRRSIWQGRESFITYSNYFENPILRDLSRRRSDFHNYRVVTIQYPKVHFLNLPGVNSVYGFQTADGYNSSFPKRYLDFWKTIVARDGKYPHVFPGLVYLMADINEYNRIDLLSLANVEYVISISPVRSNRLVTLNLIAKERLGKYIAPLYIYHNESVLPRCFAPDRIEVVASEREMMSELKRRSAKEFRERALVIRDDVERFGITKSLRNKIQVSDYGAKGDRVSFIASSEKGGLVVILNSYSPYWKVVKGGLQPEVIPVYHAFQGVYVKPGRQEVVIEYSPPYVDKLRKYL